MLFSPSKDKVILLALLSHVLLYRGETALFLQWSAKVCAPSGFMPFLQVIKMVVVHVERVQKCKSSNLIF